MLGKFDDPSFFNLLSFQDDLSVHFPILFCEVDAPLLSEIGLLCYTDPCREVNNQSLELTDDSARKLALKLDLSL